jgi:hypothetical protein
MKEQSTNLGQDLEKVQKLSSEIGDLIDLFYPDDTMTGLEIFEVLDALAAMTVFMIYSAPPDWVPTFKVYFTQRLKEIEALNKKLDGEED